MVSSGGVGVRKRGVRVRGSGWGVGSEGWGGLRSERAGNDC